MLRLRILGALLREIGFWDTARRVVRTARAGVFWRGRTISPVEEFGFVVAEPFSTGSNAGVDAGRSTINWIIPDFFSGSGGHTTLFRIIRHLERSGFQCRVVVEEPSRFPDGAIAKRRLDVLFPGVRAQVVIGRHAMPPSWATVATSWSSAYILRDFGSTRHKCYLVQDFEPAFYPFGTKHVLAEQTYRFGFWGITAGAWLGEKLTRDYGMPTVSFGFGVDHDIYCARSATSLAPDPTVFCYARPSTDRRGFELCVLALAALSRCVPRLKVIFVGGSVKQYRIPFRHDDLGSVNAPGIANALRRSRAALIISLTNLSLMPLEAMACGTPVVSNSGPNVEWSLERGKTALLSDPTPEALASALQQVLADGTLRERLIIGGLKAAEGASWPKELSKVAEFFAHLDEFADEF